MSAALSLVRDDEVRALICRGQSAPTELADSAYGVAFYRACSALGLSFWVDFDSTPMVQMGGYSTFSSCWSDYCIGTANVDMPETQDELYERGIQITGETRDHALRRALLFLVALQAMETLDAVEGG